MSAILLIAGAGAAQAAVISVGGVSQGSYGFTRVIQSGEAFTGHDVLDSQSFSAGLERSGSGGYTAPTFSTSSPAAPDVNAVPKADPWVMLLVACGIVVYQLRRKQRSLDQPPARMVSA